jgi:hypothetical protein
MDLYIEDMLEGFTEAIELMKQGNNIFEMGNVPLFPTHDRQQKWRFAKAQREIRLSNGQHVFVFTAPDGFSETNEFLLKRVTDSNITPRNFEEGMLSKGLAQVHRSDPGSIYFTLQEGYKNPTFTFRHVGDVNWRAVPKKQKPKSATIGQTRPVTVGGEVIQNISPTAVKQGMEQLLKTAEPSFFSKGITEGANSLFHGHLTPGAIAHNHGALTATGLGAGAGALYHLGRRTLYNTPEENEAEGFWVPLAMRVGIPALTLGFAGAAQNSLFSGPRPNGIPSYYDARASGNKSMYDVIPKVKLRDE